jgi:hypothetical protein
VAKKSLAKIQIFRMGKSRRSSATAEDDEQINKIRKLNSEQRALGLDLDSRTEDLADPTNVDVIRAFDDKVNELFHQSMTVKHLNTDAEMRVKLSECVEARAAKVGKAHAPITLASFVSALRSKAGGGTETKMNWASLGKQLRVYASSIPLFDVMLGPVEVVPPPKKDKAEKAVRAPKEVHALEKPVDMASAAAATTGAANKDGFQEFKKVEHEIETKLRRATLVNPDDLQSARTAVENIFCFSFLVKDGWAGWDIGPDGSVRAFAEQRPEVGKSKGLTQSVLAFTMDDWEKLVELHGTKRAVVNHREGGDETSVGANL